MINGGAEEGASTASHNNPSAYAETEETEASYPQGKSSEKEQLQHELDNAKLVIEQLKSKILDIESQKNIPRPIEATQSQDIDDLKKKIEGLEADTENAKTDNEAIELKLKEEMVALATAIPKISALEKELKIKKPLFDVGVKVRCGFLQSVKRVWVDGHYVTTHPPLDVKVIWEKNEAVHRGNYEADKALFDLQMLQATSEKRAALYTYDIRESYNLSLCPKALTLVNYRGTLMACGFLTKYTHSKAEDDRANTSMSVRLCGFLSSLPRSSLLRSKRH
jgi:hypothetical protein